MRVKRFYFDSIKEGIEEIKKRFGPETFILDIKSNGNGSPENEWEISIGIEEELDSMEDRAAPLRKRVEETWDRFFLFVKERVATMKSEFLKERIREYPLTLRILFERMVSNGLDPDLAISFVSQVFWEIGDLSTESLKANYFLKHILKKKIRIMDIRGEGSSILVLGPPGAGKTETVKKLAKFLHEEREEVSIVAYDPLRKGAYDEFMSFSKEKRIPLSFTINEEDLYSIVERNGRRKLIDLAGSMEIQKRLIKRLKETKKVAVFEANTRYESIKGYLESIGENDICGMVFTKLDNEMSIGHLINYVVHLKLPIAFFTKGLETEDIIFPSEEIFFKMMTERNPWRKREE